MEVAFPENEKAEIFRVLQGWIWLYFPSEKGKRLILRWDQTWYYGCHMLVKRSSLSRSYIPKKFNLLGSDWTSPAGLGCSGLVFFFFLLCPNISQIRWQPWRPVWRDTEQREALWWSWLGLCWVGCCWDPFWWSCLEDWPPKIRALGFHCLFCFKQNLAAFRSFHAPIIPGGQWWGGPAG